MRRDVTLVVTKVHPTHWPYYPPLAFQQFSLRPASRYIFVSLFTSSLDFRAALQFWLFFTHRQEHSHSTLHCQHLTLLHWTSNTYPHSFGKTVVSSEAVGSYLSTFDFCNKSDEILIMIDK